MRLLWAVTGAGHMMRQSAEVFEELSKRHEITVIFTRPGYEIARLYGVLETFKKNTGGRYRELEVDPKPLSHVYGRVMRKVYKALIISPASANSVNKFALGIADNLVTTAYAMARKVGLKIYIVPSDAPWVKETELPCIIEGCVGCKECPPQNICPTKAIEGDRVRRIILESCIGCELCIKACPFSAISCFKRAPVSIHPLEVEYLRKVEEMGAVILKEPKELLGIF